MSPDSLPPSLEAGSAVRVLAPGELLFQQGDRAAAIYRVESGRLRLIRRTVDDHLVILHTARRGEFGVIPENPKAARSNSSMKASITRTGFSSLT